MIRPKMQRHLGISWGFLPEEIVVYWWRHHAVVIQTEHVLQFGYDWLVEDHLWLEPAHVSVTCGAQNQLVNSLLIPNTMDFWYDINEND